MDNGCDELDRLMADLRVQLPGATDTLIKAQLFNAIDWHLRRTNAWRYISLFNLQQGDLQYPIFPPADTELVRVISITHGGRPLAPVGAGGTTVSSARGRLSADLVTLDSDAAYDADVVTGEGDPAYYAIYYPTYVTVDVPPSVESVQFPMEAVLAITLGPDCRCTEDDEGCNWALEPWMYIRYHDDWLWGTLSRMMAMLNKPWSNPQMALMWGKRSYSRASFAKQEAERGFVHNVQIWRFPRGGFL